MTELRPCPFCGSKAVIQEPGFNEWRVICSNPECGAMIFSRYAEPHGDVEAMEKWNRRMNE